MRPVSAPQSRGVLARWWRRPHGAAARRTVIGIPFLFLILFFSLPFLVVLRISVSEVFGVHFGNLLSYADGVATLRVDLSNYQFLASDSLYLKTYWSSICYAALNTLICLAIGYPFAYFMARATPSRRLILVMMVSLPFWTSYLLRVYAWRGLLEDNGLINHLLIWAHVIDTPIKMMYTAFAMMVAMVYTYLPFMILPVYANLTKLDGRLLEAASDLGARPFTTFWLVTVPLSRAGIIAGSMLVFIPSIGEYVIPEMMGGPQTLMIGRVLWDEFSSNNDWAMASAVAVTMVLLILVPLALFNRYQGRALDAGGRPGSGT